MRWHTPDGRVIVPKQFMKVAERNPVIRPMTWWAIKAANARLSHWPEHMGLSINVPPNLLLDREILAVLQDAQAIYGVNPNRLTLEITENMSIEDHQNLVKQIDAIVKFGVRISIDDFGTGYSSLAHFRNFKVQELKIDKSFVKRMVGSEIDLAIVKTVINLARNFSMRVVAEGVEDETTAKALAELGCDQLQGFLFDKPLQLDDFNKRYLT